MNRKQLLKNLNAKRRRLRNNGAEWGEIRKSIGFDYEQLGDLPTSKLEQFYQKSVQYGSLTVRDGAVLPTEYVKRVDARARYNGNYKKGQMHYRKSFDLAKNSSIMKNHSSVANMLGKTRRFQEQTQKDYVEALKKHGLYVEAHKIAQMSRKKFGSFLESVGYYGTFPVVYASKAKEGYSSDYIQNIKQAINDSQVYQQFTPNFKYNGKQEGA